MENTIIAKRSITKIELTESLKYKENNLPSIVKHPQMEHNMKNDFEEVVKD